MGKILEQLLMKTISMAGKAKRRDARPAISKGLSALGLNLYAVFTLLFLVWAAGCEQRHDPAASDAFGLPRAQLQIGDASVDAEIANTPTSSERGLMYRSSMAENHGMLFVFDNPRKANFWMKNTKIPLSIAYLDETGIILEIKSMKPYDETVVPSSTDHVEYALEMNEGWFGQHGIVAGRKVQGIPK
jgi:uncharacterized membrane protein (UPF0127 family)